MLYDLYFTASVWDVDGWMDGGVQKGKMKVKWLVASIARQARQADRQTDKHLQKPDHHQTIQYCSNTYIHTYISHHILSHFLSFPHCPESVFKNHPYRQFVPGYYSPHRLHLRIMAKRETRPKQKKTGWRKKRSKIKHLAWCLVLGAWVVPGRWRWLGGPALSSVKKVSKRCQSQHQKVYCDFVTPHAKSAPTIPCLPTTPADPPALALLKQTIRADSEDRVSGVGSLCMLVPPIWMMTEGIYIYIYTYIKLILP